MKKQKSYFKSVMSTFVALLLCVLIGGSAIALARNWSNSGTPPNDSTDAETSEGLDSSSGAEESETPEVPEEDEGTGLVDPANKAELLVEGMTVRAEPELDISGDTPAIRWDVYIPTALKNQVAADDNVTLSYYFGPVNFFDGVNPEGYTYIDWITTLNGTEGGKPLKNDIDVSTLASAADGTWRFGVRMYNILSNNYWRGLVGFVVISTKSGDSTTYKYMDDKGGDYRARTVSVASLTSDALNAQAMGKASYTDEEVTKLKGYINEVVDYANGLETPTDDNSTFSFTVTPSTMDALSVGQTMTLTTNVLPALKSDIPGIPVGYSSEDESIATVDSKGRVKALKTGTTKIKVYVAGEVQVVRIEVK